MSVAGGGQPRGARGRFVTEDPDVRFFARLSSVGWEECWLWTGRLDPKGYGIFTVGHQPWKAHRYAYERFVGPIPEGAILDHLACDTRRCANPAHVTLSTHLENVGRGKALVPDWQPGQCRRGHPFTPDNTYVSKSGKRHCRACQRIRQRGYRRG